MTIKEVAQLAGVSPATVSRYLNGGSLSAEKRAAVSAAVEKTGYRPDIMAQTLRTGRLKQVGVIVPKLQSDSVPQVTAGIMNELHNRGWLMMLSSTTNQTQQELRYLEAMQENRMAGIILMGTILTEQHREIFRNSKIPIVITGQKFEDMPCVYHDDFNAARNLALRMTARGRRHIAYLGVPEKDAAVGLSRYQGVRSALAAVGLSETDMPYLIGGFDAQSGYSGTVELLARYPNVDGIICATDTIALGALSALKAQGRSVPEQISLAGIGDSWAGTISEPPLTTAHLYYEQCGADAARMLLHLIEEPDCAGAPHQTRLAYTLVERNSI